MIEHAHGLTSTALEAIADLERRVVAADGGRLKLEWATLRGRPVEEVRDLLWWEDGRLLGFAGIYGSGRRPFELAGMVAPDARRRGIGRALLDAAAANCRGRGSDRLLLIVPRTSAGGDRFARAAGSTHEHSEHALRLRARPGEAAAKPGLNLRQATVEDIPVLSELYRDGFHDDGHVDPDRLEGERSRTLMIALSGEPVGTIALVRDGDRGAIHAFVVGSPWRGRGIGRRALSVACVQLFDAGVQHVDLEVEVDNDHALGLYTSVGFELLATDDYYELMLEGRTV